MFSAWVACGIGTQASAQELEIVVPVIYNHLGTSRAAHFNWEFESSGGGDVQIGQFACGSYWIAPANGDTGIRVLSLGGNPSWTDYVSCDADPITENHGLLDGSKNYGSHDADEDIVPDLPLTFTPSSGSCISLVAAMQRNEAATGPAGTSAIQGEAVDAYCIVTLMPSPPANDGDDMIRPNITGTTKEFLTWDDFDLTRIPTYSFIDGKTTQEWADTQTVWRGITEIFGMLTEVNTDDWTYFSEGGRAFRSHILIDEYGAGMARRLSDDILALFSDDNTLAEKKPTLAAILAFALDLYHSRYDYGSNLPKAWVSGAGQRVGCTLPLMLLGALSEDSAKPDVLRKIAITAHGDDIAELAPQELRQITRGVTGVLLWGDGTPFLRNGNNLNEEDRRYWSNFRKGSCFDTAVGSCNAGAGKKIIADPYGYIDGPAEKPGTSYMGVSFGAIRALAAAMILMPEIRSIVNTDAPIEYVDRAERFGLWTSPDPVAPVSIDDQNNVDCNPWTGGGDCDDYFIDWGPDPSDVRFAIEDGTGRFTSMHGNTFTPTAAYESNRAEDNWSTIIAMYDGDTYEDNVVALGVVVAPEILFETGSSPQAHILCATPDADIRYTTDGSTPTTSSSLYSGPFSVSDQTEVKAKGFLSGYTASAVRTREFNPSSGSSDTTAPSVPTGLAASNITSSSVDLDWNASTDDVGVTGYKIYTGGANPVQVYSTSVTLSQLTAETGYTFTVSAFDAADNESSQSSGVSVTTSASGTSTIVAVTASADDGNGNVASNTIDDNLSTRWSANGDGNWIRWELDGTYTITSVELAFYNGSSRNYDFVLEVSEDGSNWTQVFSGQSGGSTNDLETFDVTDDDALYLRYTGYGNSSNDWNSVTEVEIQTSGASADTTAPSTPTGLSVDTTTAATVELSWNASTDNIGVTGYKVYTGGGNPVTVTGTSAVLTGLSPSTGYTFTVSAIDAASNESSQSTSVQPTTAANGNGTIDTVTASGDDGNIPSNTLDGSLSTRWSSNGDGEWIQFQLDGQYTLLSIDIAFHNGASRTSSFDIQVSTDGSNWSTVYSGQSSGTTTALETFDTTDSTASYIRYLGHGNSNNDWNSLTEVELGL